MLARVETYYQSYGIVLAVAIGGALLVSVAFLAAKVIAPNRPVAEKLLTYECGMDPVGEGWSQTQVRYFLYAFLFVIFDVESVFLFPWALVFERLGYTAVVEMAVFIGILAVGLLYAYKKGVLHWEGYEARRVRISTPPGFTRVPVGAGASPALRGSGSPN
jgi:NADH-quinone oxidoreductase subunit A